MARFKTPTAERPFPKGTRVKTRKHGYGIVVELNETDKEVKVFFSKPTKTNPEAGKAQWFAYRELEITGR
jgi:hypothetical protein